ncbi:hypothetical protein KC335_g8559, partial [Hortaea werneckii]
MTHRIVLPFWPTALDCVDWSGNNQLAVAGGENVAVLSPSFREAASDGSHWTSIVFEANAFTANELPRQAPLSFPSFSLGEEISTWQVQRVKWSSPGIARYGGCLLAVLTSNHALSLWECEGKPDLLRSWKRKIVLNDSLRKHYGYSRAIPEDSDSEASARQRCAQQVSLRIKSFCWSPHQDQSQGDSHIVLSSVAHTETHLLAVSTEGGDICILRLTPPVGQPEEGWSSKVMCTFEADPDGAAGEGEELTWHGWNSHEFCRQSTLSYIHNGNLHHIVIRYTDAGENASDFKIQRLTAQGSGTSAGSLRGPLRYLGNHMLLTSPFDCMTITSVPTLDQPPGVAQESRYDLGERWDPVSGAVMSRDTNGAPVVHFTTLTTTASADTCSLQTLAGEQQPSQTPPWKQAIAESKATFSAEHNLDGHVQERTWGIAASPSGDCIATCITLHPSDAVANIVPHVQKCLLLLSPCDSNIFYALQNPTAQEDKLFCPPVAEDLYFNRLQHPDNQPKQWADSCVSLIRSFAPISKDFSDGLDPVLLAESARTKLYFETNIVKARFEVLAAMFKKDRRSISDKHHVILQGLMGQVSALASLDLQQGALGTRMAQCYAVLSDKLHAGETDEAASSARNQEVCTICGQEIPMESIKWGRCSGGHQFPRCAVTMLPISDPNLNFFDDNSDDDIPTAGSTATDGQDINLLGRTAVLPSKRQRRSPEPELVSQCDIRNSVTNPDAEGYQRLEPRGTQEEHIRFADTPATSFNGSVTELLSGGDHSSPPRRSSGVQVADGAIGRNSPHFDRFNEQHRVSPQPQNEQVLAAHAIAHEITLQALMRDEETLDRTLQSFAPLKGGARASLLPSSLKPHDPRSPRHQTFVSPKTLASSNKKVHVVPAPIDTSAPRRSLPADIVRTPYPHMPENVYRKDLGRSPPSAPSITSPPIAESLLAVSIRRSNRHSRPRVTSIVIPAPNAYSATRTSDSEGKPHHLRADEFDDAQFFQQLRHAYRRLLSGPIRILSARSLKR